MPNVFVARILAFSLIVFQLLVTILYFNWLSICLFVLIIILQFMFYAFASSLEEERYYKSIIDNFLTPFENATFKRYKVKDLKIDDATYKELNSYFSSNTLIEASKHTDAIDSSIEIVEVLPANDEVNISVKTYFFFNGMRGYIFIPSGFEINTPFNKFIIYHEILHCSYFATSGHSENTALRYIFLIILVWCPFLITFNIQSILLLVVIALLTFDVWGTSFNKISENEKIFREIWADHIAIKLLKEEEIKTIVETVRGYLKNGKFLFYDSSLGYSGNAVRMSKLANITTFDSQPNLESLETTSLNFIPVSRFDVYWRLLLVILLGFYGSKPSYWHIILCIFLIILCIVLTREISRYTYQYFIYIEEKINKKDSGV